MNLDLRHHRFGRGQVDQLLAFADGLALLEWLSPAVASAALDRRGVHDESVAGRHDLGHGNLSFCLVELGPLLAQLRLFRFKACSLTRSSAILAWSMSLSNSATLRFDV